MKKSIIYFLLILIFNSYAFYSPLNASNTQIEECVIRGKVTDSVTKQPVEGAKIIVDPRNLKLGALTDRNGEYEIKLKNLPDGMVLEAIVFLSKGYKDVYYNNVIVKSGQTIEFNAALKRPEKQVRKIFRIHHRDPAEIAEAIKLIFGITVENISRTFNTIVAEQTPETIARIDSLIKQLDVPLKNIWLEVCIIRASETGKENKNYPQAIESALKKLSSLFKFRSYEVVGRAQAIGTESAVLRFSGSTDDSKLGGFFVNTKLAYSNKIISLKNIKIDFQKSSANQILTTINIKNEETVILGVSQSSIKESAIITLITAKLVE